MLSPTLYPGIFWKSTVWPWQKRCWGPSAMALTVSQCSSPCPGSVSFTKMGQEVHVTHAIATLQVTKYMCPLNTKELEPKSKGFKRTVCFRETASEPNCTTDPSWKRSTSRSAGVSWVSVGWEQDCESCCMAPAPKQGVNGTSLRR